MCPASSHPRHPPANRLRNRLLSRSLPFPASSTRSDIGPSPTCRMAANPRQSRSLWTSRPSSRSRQARILKIRSAGSLPTSTFSQAYRARRGSSPVHQLVSHGRGHSRNHKRTAPHHGDLRSRKAVVDRMHDYMEDEREAMREIDW